MDDQIRLINAPLFLEYEEINEETYDTFKREYDTLSEADDDPVGSWLKQAKSRGETSESDHVLVTLMVELHRKIDELSAKLNDEKKIFTKLDKKVDILSIGFEHFKISNTVLSVDKNYYGRVEMPLFPKRIVPMFFKGHKEDIVKIELLHDRDAKDWSGYVTSRERVMIRELKGIK